VSAQSSTTKREDVGIIFHNLLNSWDYDNNCEVLLYCQNGEWIVTVDRQFYSLGLKKDDPETYWQKTIKEQQDEINRLRSKLNAIKKIMGEEKSN
jgi:hypothetical protein